MSARPRNCSRRWSRAAPRRSGAAPWRSRGATLVEAVAALALLGGLLVAVLLAGARLTTQRGRAERRLQACRLADRWLENQWAKRDELPRASEGAVEGVEGWRWRTRVIAAGLDRESASALGGEVVALELLAPGAGDGEPAARVELILQRKNDEAQAGVQPH